MPFLGKKCSAEKMVLNYTERQLDIFSVSHDSLNAFHSSCELHDFIDKMDAINLLPGSDLVEWKLTPNRQFTVKSCYGFLNDGGLRSKFQEDIWKVVVPLMVKIFTWLATHDKTLSREKLERQGWFSKL